MRWIRFALVKLIALAVIAAGLAGLRTNEFSRMFVQNASYTFSKATPLELDAIFKVASEVAYGDYDDVITREPSNDAKTLKVVIQANSWEEISNDERAFRARLQKAASARNLIMDGTSTSMGRRASGIFESRRMNFIASAALTAFGIAMLVLSLRIFGGGRREEVPELGPTAGS